jgi:hypothetical protein
MVQKVQFVDLNTPEAHQTARIAIPLVFGLWSLWLGQDSNWDLLNYHLYNAFSFLNGKLHTDLAPAGMQSYFNPLLDVSYYMMNKWLPAQVVGFLMGVIHGLNFVLVLEIARRALANLPEEDRFRVPLLLSVAGCLTANFLSGIGNSMGDNTTTLFVLGALLLVLRNWKQFANWSLAKAAILLGIGAIVGVGTGLKLTNAVYALALCAGFLAYPSSWFARIRLSFVFGIGVLVGLAISNGYWLLEMWRTFGNPLFPQFSSIFPNPLAVKMSVGDSSWLPNGILEIILWPFILTFDSQRVGQAKLHQVVWALLYILFWWWAAARLAGRLRRSHTSFDPRVKYLIVFVATGFVLWMLLFSIYRYIVPIEMVAPLVVFILLTKLLAYEKARFVAARMLGAATLIVLAGGVSTWGHAGWANPAFQVDIPRLDEPEKTTVLVAATAPSAWLATAFPTSVAFASIGGFFQTPAFTARIHEMIASRSGPAFVIVDAPYKNWRIKNIEKANSIVSKIGLTNSKDGCEKLRWAVARLHLHAIVQKPTGAIPGAVCELGLRADDVKDPAEENRKILAGAIASLKQNDLRLDAESCGSYKASIGQDKIIYQWCKVTIDR